MRYRRKAFLRGHRGVCLVDDVARRLARRPCGQADRGVQMHFLAAGEALSFFRASPDAVDAVLTDLSMPHMTGLQLGRSLLGIRPEVPIVLFTGYSADLSPEDVRTVGFRTLVNEPVTPATIAEVLHRALDGGHGKGLR